MRRSLLTLVSTALLLTTTACAPSEPSSAASPADSPSTAPTSEKGAAKDSEAATPTTSYYAASPDAIGFIDCVGSEPIIEPATVTTDCINNDDPVKWMAWRIWNDKRAVGWGRLNGKEVVKIELSQPVETSNGEKVFSQVAMDGTQLLR